ncbi:hypothetical protein J6590_003087 [Homalodisca vitripennis]|nr:hypothetical protein J6590_003087 [Homalodisca vitripennis]
MLIKGVLENKDCGNNMMLVTAPPKFGKSTNLNMLKRFMEIEVDNYGVPKTKVNLTTDNINDIENFKLFHSRNLAIMKHPTALTEFGRTPVIEVAFEHDYSESIQTMYDVIKVCKHVIHNSFKLHEYLVYSEKLTEDHKQYVRMWCDDHSYKTMVDSLYVSHGLQSLSQYLYRHFGETKVFLLVDNYDSIIRSATFSSKTKSDLSEIIRYMAGIMRDSVTEFVQSVFVTGVSEIPWMVSQPTENVTIYKFSDGHEFDEYYGITENEINYLFEKSGHHLSNEVIKAAKGYYGGYQTKTGIQLYNPYSVHMLFRKGILQRYFTKDCLPEVFHRYFTPQSVREDLECLTKDHTIRVKVPVNLTIEHLMQLQSSKTESKFDKRFPYSILWILLEWGFLTYSLDGNKSDDILQSDFVSVRIPNGEINEFFNEIIFKFDENKH